MVARAQGDLHFGVILELRGRSGQRDRTARPFGLQTGDELRFHPEGCRTCGEAVAATHLPRFQPDEVQGHS